MAQRKRMVNNQTSQHELLISISYLSRLGIFQCVRAILQLSLPIDHPVLTDHLKEIHVKKVDGEFKCEKCGYVGKTDVSLNKHINTRHTHDTVESSSAEIKLHEVACVLSFIDDLFQMEIVEGEQLYACNVCDEGVEKFDQIRNHIENNHKENNLTIKQRHK